MKIKTETATSKGKAKKNKYTSDNILPHIKTEILSNDEHSNEDIRLKSDKLGSQGSAAKELVDTNDLISNLIKKETEDLSKKRKRKSLNNSQLFNNDPKRKKLDELKGKLKHATESVRRSLGVELEKRLSLNFDSEKKAKQIENLNNIKKNYKSLSEESDNSRIDLPLPKKIKSEFLKKGEKHKKEQIKQEQQDTSSSAEEATSVPLPKKFKLEVGLKNDTQLRRVDTKEPSSTSDEDGELFSEKLVRKYQQVPKPRVTKIEQNKQSSDETADEVPQPVLFKKEQSSDVKSNKRVKQKVKPKHILQPKPVQRIEHYQESSDEEITQLPQPKILEKVEKKQKIKHVLVPRPVKKQVSDTDSNESVDILINKKPVQVPYPKAVQKRKSSDEESDEEIKQIPQPKIIKKEEGNQDNKSRDVRKRSSNDKYSSEDTEVPRPIIIKKSEKYSNETSQDKKKNKDTIKKSSLKNTNESENSKSHASFEENSIVQLSKTVKREESSEDEDNGHVVFNGVVDSDVDQAHNEISKSSWEQQIKLQCPDLEKQINNVDLPHVNNEHYLLRIPKYIDPVLLLRKKCRLREGSRLVLNNEIYTLQLKTSIPTVISGRRAKIISLKGVVTMQKALNYETLNETGDAVVEKAQLPGAVKNRHPLFGVGYRKKLKLDNSVQTKVQEALENKQKYKRKEQKKKRKQKSAYKDDFVDFFNATTAELFSSSNEISVNTSTGSAKKKNRTNNDLVDESMAIIKNESFLNKKHKHKKKKTQ